MLVQFEFAIIEFKKFLWQPNWTRPTASSNFGHPRNFFFIHELFPKLSACIPITYTYYYYYYYYYYNNMILIWGGLGKKKSESQVGFEPTTLRDLVGCSNHLSYWRLYGEQGPICGSRLEPHHAATQPSNGGSSLAL